MQIIESLSRNGASESTIQQFEGEIARRLPDDYRQFIAQTNGGRPDPSRFTIHSPNGANDSVVDWFLTLDSSEKLYTVKKYSSMYQDRIPSGVIPIGCDPFGNLLLLDVGTRDFGCLYFWDHEKESMDDRTWDNISLLATSFTEFVQRLH
jgi:hypothetical protein